jgi:hypothetical protein
MTADKQALIEDSKGEVINHWHDILDASLEAEEQVVFALSEVKETMRSIYGKVYETPLQFKKEAVAKGWLTAEARIAIDGGLSYVVISPTLLSELDSKVGEGDPKALRSWLTSKLQRMKDRVKNQM